MKTPITYYGGKQTVLKHILPLIPKHELYTEPFCGGASVFFAKKSVACEVLNDLNIDLVNFYQVAKTNFIALKSEIDKTLHSKDAHEHAQHILSHRSYYNEVQRAWAVWALSKMSFASMLDGSFGYDFSGAMPLKLKNAKDTFTEEICRRLDSVTIENIDALELIKKYDVSNAFHFVDPPYINSDCGHYEGLFSTDNMVELLELLSNIKGKFMLTMFPLDVIKQYADNKGWIIYSIERTISASKTSRRSQEEWIVCNYELENKQATIF